MTPRRLLQVAIFPALLALVMAGSVAGCYFATAALYAAIGHAPPAVLAQVINALLGLVLSVAVVIGVIAFISSRAQSRRQWMGIAEPIFATLEQIAKGDFQVRVDTPTIGNNTLVSEMASSVNQMAAELSQMEHLRQEFISDVSHEFQSPLTSIRGFARALNDSTLSSVERQHYLDIIEAESMRLSRITENMLRLVSLESEYMRIEAKPYPLDKQLRMLVLACEPQWAAKALEMDLVLDGLTIRADEDLLGQVWSNLLHNSIKFTPAGGRVSVAAHRCGERIACTFADNGIGIADEAQAHIFDRFYKADTARERSREGSGLGLAIAKKIVELHHGSISVTSQPGAGTTFVVSLPTE